MTERCFSFDLEWAAQDYPERGVKRGDLACLQWCELLQDGTTTEPELLAAWPGADQRARELFREALRPGWVIVGQNVAGDMLVAALQWGLLAEADEAYRRGAVRCTMLRQRLIDVAWPGRLTWIPVGGKRKGRAAEAVNLDDVDDSQLDRVGGQEGFWAPRKFRFNKLLGREEMFVTDDEDGGRGLQAKAGLDALAALHLGVDLRELKKGEGSWRKRYGELIGMPVDEWPEDARRYALDDPVWTARVCAAQARRPAGQHGGQWVDVVWPAPGSPPWAPLRCERFEAHAAFAFADMERLGMARDQPRVERMRATLQRAAQAAERTAIRAGVVRLDVRARQAGAVEAGLVALEVKHDAAAGKAAGLAPGEVRALFREARDAAAAGDRARVEALAAAHSWISVREKRDAQAAGLIAAEARAIADRRDVDALTEFAAAHPWLEVQRVKATDEVLSRAVALYKGAGWRELPRTKTGTSISAEAEHLQQVVRPAPGAPEDAAADLRALISPDMIGHLQAWVDAGEPERIERALACANDPGLAAHMARQKCSTYDKAFLARLDARSRRQDPERYPDPDGPARYGVSTFKATGRTGIRGDIGQNWPQRGGVRECIVPRPGRVFLVADFAACEMSTFADVLDELVLGGRGWSTLGTAIRSGDDCHLRLAATMRGEPYAQLRAFYKPIKDKIEREGKGAIGKGELRDWLDLDLDRAGAKEGNFGYAGGMGAKKFARLQRKKGRDCDEARARRIRDAWLECWSPEVPAYFELASQATGDRGGRKSATVVHMRGGHVRGGLDFCQWANTHFQQLAAAGAKRAAILLFRACRLDTTSPLYGVADPALFVHDEFILECDEHAAEAALKEQERLMARGMAAVCRTPVKAEGKILRERWSK